MVEDHARVTYGVGSGFRTGMVGSNGGAAGAGKVYEGTAASLDEV